MGHKTKTKSIRIYGLAVGFYVFVGLLVGIPALSKHRVAAQVATKAAQLQQTSPVSKQQQIITGTPVRFAIDRLGIQLPIRSGIYDPGHRSWTLDNSHVFINTYGGALPQISTSAKVQPNVTLFYGHEIPSVVGNTNDIVPGDILTVTTTNGYVFTYAYQHSQVVSPNSTAILATPNKTPTVALMTCSGIWSQSRRIMYFSPLIAPQLVATPKGSV